MIGSIRWERPSFCARVDRYTDARADAAAVDSQPNSLLVRCMSPRLVLLRHTIEAERPLLRQERTCGGWHVSDARGVKSLRPAPS